MQVQDFTQLLGRTTGSASGGTGFNLSSILGGGASGSTASGTSSIASLIAQFTGGSKPSNGGFMSYAHAAGSGALAGAAGGPWAAAAGAAIGLASKFMGGNPRVGFTKNDEVPHKVPRGGPGYLDMSTWNEEDGNSYARWAIENGSTVEDIEFANMKDREESPQNSWEQCVAWWRANPSRVTEDLRRWGVLGTAASGGTVPMSAGSPGNGFAGGGGPGLNGALSLGAGGGSSMSAADYLKSILTGALNGAGKGAGDAAADTPMGQQVKRDTFNGYLKTYQLPIAGALAGIGFLAYKAFNK